MSEPVVKRFPWLDGRSVEILAAFGESGGEPFLEDVVRVEAARLCGSWITIEEAKKLWGGAS